MFGAFFGHPYFGRAYFATGVEGSFLPPEPDGAVTRIVLAGQRSGIGAAVIGQRHTTIPLTGQS